MTHLITKDNQKNAIKTHVDCITLQIIAKILWFTPYVGTLGVKYPNFDKKSYPTYQYYSFIMQNNHQVHLGQILILFL